MYARAIDVHPRALDPAAVNVDVRIEATVPKRRIQAERGPGLGERIDENKDRAGGIDFAEDISGIAAGGRGAVGGDEPQRLAAAQHAQLTIAKRGLTAEHE